MAVSVPYVPQPSYGQTVQPYGTNTYGTGYNPFNNRDVYNLYQNLGQQAAQQGQSFQNNQANLSNYYQNLSSQYGNLTNDLYNPIWQGGGGYNPEQMGNILQSQGLDYIEGQNSSNFLTQDQIAAMVGNSGSALGNFVPQAQNIQSMTSNPDLLLSQNYMPGVNTALQTGAGQLNAAETNPNLSPTSTYLSQAQMTDQQVQDTAEAAARSVGAQYGATKDQVIQAARASGTGTPLGIASALTSLDRSSSADQADALTNARLQALAAQRQAAQNVQNTQLNAGQYQAGLTSSNALAEQNANIAAQTTGEQLRLGAQQYKTGQDVAAGQWASGTEAQLQQQAEAANAARWGTVAQNEQATQEYNQQMQLQSNNLMSQRYQTAYQPWVQQQAMGLQAAPAQQQWYGQQGNTATGQQLQGWQTQNQGEQAAAAGYAGWGANQQANSFGSNFTKGFASGFGGSLGKFTGGGYREGGVIDHHQLIEVGEHDKPEVILPLAPSTPPESRNPYEKLGARLGEALGIKGYASGGAINVTDPNEFARDLEAENISENPEDVTRYARGGMVPRPMMPHISIPKIHAPGIRLNMPLRMPRIQAPIRPAMLPQGGVQKFDRGGIVGPGGSTYNPGMSYPAQPVATNNVMTAPQPQSNWQAPSVVRSQFGTPQSYMAPSMGARRQPYMPQSPGTSSPWNQSNFYQRNRGGMAPYTERGGQQMAA